MNVRRTNFISRKLHNASGISTIGAIVWNKWEGRWPFTLSYETVATDERLNKEIWFDGIWNTRIFEDEVLQPYVLLNFLCGTNLSCILAKEITTNTLRCFVYNISILYFLLIKLYFAAPLANSLIKSIPWGIFFNYFNSFIHTQLCF